MRTLASVGLLLCGLAAPRQGLAQGASPELLREVAAVKEAMTKSNESLRHYTWTENTEVLIKGDVKKSTNSICRYDAWGKLEKKPVTPGKPDETPQTMSKRPINRKKADMADYVERTLSLVHDYLPPKPEQVEYLLKNGNASLGQSSAGKAEIRFKRYAKDGDSLTFTYDPVSKALLSVNINSYLTEKDPVTLDAVFETLPDGTNHLASAVLNGTAKKIEVKSKNSTYQKVAN